MNKKMEKLVKRLTRHHETAMKHAERGEYARPGSASRRKNYEISDRHDKLFYQTIDLIKAANEKGPE